MVDINLGTSATNDQTLKVRRDRTSFVNPHSYPTACCGRTNDQDPLDRQRHADHDHGAQDVKEVNAKFCRRIEQVLQIIGTTFLVLIFTGGKHLLVKEFSRIVYSIVGLSLFQNK